MRARVARIRGDARTRERHGAFDRVVERGDDVRRRGSGSRPRTGHVAEVVVDSHVAAAERDAEPQRAGEAAIRAGILRIGGDRLLEGFERAIAIQVVDFSGATGAQRHRRAIGAGRPGDEENARKQSGG
jgi:hypothetical protein